MDRKIEMHSEKGQTRAPVEIRPHRSASVRVTRTESDVGSWEIASRGPLPRLQKYVIGYVGLKSTMRVTRERHLPSGEAALVVNLGTPHQIVSSADRSCAFEFRDVAVMGLHDLPFITKSAGDKHLLVVRLTPIGAHALLDVRMGDFLNRWVDLNNVDKGLAGRMTERVRDLTGWEALFEFIDSLIDARTAAAPARASEVAWAWEQIRGMGGSARIGSLARDLGWSHKRLLAQFREHVGLLPKATSEIVRFNRILRLQRFDPRANWAGIAMDCGYHDQAHMIREFKTFAGGTPNEIRRLVAGFTLREPNLDAI